MTGRGRALNRYVVDTNIVIATMQGAPEAVAFMEGAESTKSDVLYSVIVEAELFSSSALTEDDKRDLRNLLSMGETVDVNSEVGLKAAELRALSKRLYQRKLRLPDALVAATALMMSATLVTRNVQDFEHLVAHGLRIHNPFGPSSE